MALAARRRRRSIVGPFGWLSIAVLGLLVWLLVTGREIPFVGRVVRAMDAEGPPAGHVAVPATARPIPAYAAVERDDFWDRQAGKLKVVYLTPETIEARGIVTSFGDVIGRVVSHDKGAGYVFTADDFLPKGVRPGITAGIPPGKRGLRIDPDQVSGLGGLRAGDRFDLVATLPVDDSRALDTIDARIAGVWAQELRREAQWFGAVPRASVSIIVQDGVVVAPLETRSMPYTANTLTQGAVQRNRTVNEMAIAIDPSEVAALTEQLAIGAVISCFPRSSHPDDPSGSPTPGLEVDRSGGSAWLGSSRLGPLGSADPGGPAGSGAGMGGFHLVERLSGTERLLLPVPAAGLARSQTATNLGSGEK